jgi:hypothetical protein
LHRAVADVHQLGRDIALPEPREPFIGDDVLDRRDGALVGGPAAKVLVSERVGEGVCLELQAYLDDVEGRDDES